MLFKSVKINTNPDEIKRNLLTLVLASPVGQTFGHPRDFLWPLLSLTIPFQVQLSPKEMNEGGSLILSGHFALL